MKISAKNKQKLYKSINDVITDLKIELCRVNGGAIYHQDKKVDERICFLDVEIWKNIKKNLEIKD